jgi:hypothetical protein
MSHPFSVTLNTLYTQYTQGTTEPTPEGFVTWVANNPPPTTPKGVPHPGTICGTIWGYLNGLVTGGVPFTRGSVINHLVGAGINPSTASTQYQRWVKYTGYKVTQGNVNLPPVTGVVAK